MNNMEEIAINFSRKDKKYPISGVSVYFPTKKMVKPIIKLYKWILNKHNNINILLTNSSQVFFNDIKSFCISNDLDYKYPLHLYAYINENKSLYIEIEQGDDIDCLNFDNSIYCKITIENNLGRILTIDELNNIH